MMNTSLPHNRERGFTLIEMVVVIIIMGILATVAFKTGSTVHTSAAVEKNKRELDALAKGIVGNPDLHNDGVRTNFGYVGDVGAMPPNLDALFQNPGGYSTWNGPYVSNRLDQVTDDFKTDALGGLYLYSGGVTLTALGSGSVSDVVRKLGNSTDDFLVNEVSGAVFDKSGTPPGSIERDSVTILCSHPDGAGGTTTRSTTPDAGGYFSFDSVPIGNHDLTIVYTPEDDTIARYVAVAPKSSPYGQYYFTDAHFSVAGGGGGSTTSEIIRPTGAGSNSALSSSGCSNNWECTDETSSDGNGSYVYGNSTSSYRNDSYAASDHTGSGTIDSVVVHMIVIRSSSGSQRARTLIRTNGSEFTGTDYNLNSVTSYTEFSDTYSTNPATSSAWTWTEIDDLEIGVSIRKAGRCTQVWAEVFYTN